MGESTIRFALVIGEAALRIWADLPRDSQEHLFDAATGSDDHLRHQLAFYLHDYRSRTAHPQKPIALA